MLPKKTPAHYETADIIITSDDFIEAQWPRLTVSERRVVLYLLALVEKEDSDFEFYRIPVRKLGEILRSEDKNLCKEFDKAADGLMKKIITWSEPENQKKQHRAAWCAYAALSKEEGFAEISYAPQLKPFLLSLRENFTPHELSAVIRLRNHYSLKIYRLLKYNRSNTDKSLTVSLDQLKEYLGINPGEYNHFGHFKTKVIVPAQKDISEKTDIKFSFEQIKENRKIRYIRFLLENNPAYKEPDPPLPCVMSLKEPSASENFPVSDKNRPISDPGTSAILKEELKSSGADETDIPEMLANHSPEVLRKAIENFRFIRICMESGNEDLAENLSEYFKSLLPEPGRDFEYTDEYKTHLEAKEFRKRIQAEEAAAAYKKELEGEYREFLTSEVRRLIRENPEQAAVFEKRAEAGLIDQARTNTFLARLYKHREKSPRWRRHVEMQTEFLMQEELLPSFDEWVKERKP